MAGDSVRRPLASPRPDLLILGASVRAAAQSAVRAGLSVLALDRFGDVDLVSNVAARRIEGDAFPEAAIAETGDLPPCPWLYTGPLENHPDLVDRLSATWPLLGNGSDVLRAVRDPFRLSEALRVAGFPALEVRLDPSGLPRDGTWLVKPLASGGGLGVVPLTADVSPVAGRFYFQRRGAGSPHSVVAIADLFEVRTIGITRQRTGMPRHPFGYRGSIGPIRLSESEMAEVDRLARMVGQVFGLRGLFGVDFLRHEGRPWVVEVNPRYTASVEVLELALRRPLLEDHLAACGFSSRANSASDPGWSEVPTPIGGTPHPGPPPQGGREEEKGSPRAFPSSSLPPCGGGPGWGVSDVADATEPLQDIDSATLPIGVVVGKQILFADRTETVKRSLQPMTWHPGQFSIPTMADLPAEGTVVSAGDPILTVFASAGSLRDCEVALDAATRDAAFLVDTATITAPTEALRPGSPESAAPEEQR